MFLTLTRYFLEELRGPIVTFCVWEATYYVSTNQSTNQHRTTSPPLLCYRQWQEVRTVELVAKQGGLSPGFWQSTLGEMTGSANKTKYTMSSVLAAVQDRVTSIALASIAERSTVTVWTRLCTTAKEKLDSTVNHESKNSPMLHTANKVNTLRIVLLMLGCKIARAQWHTI